MKVLKIVLGVLLVIAAIIIIAEVPPEGQKVFQNQDLSTPAIPALEIDSTTTNENHPNKYYFIAIAISQPVSWTTTYINGEPIKDIKWDDEFYTTDINSSNVELTEDMKYKWLDEAETHIRSSQKSTVSLMVNQSMRTLFRELYKFDSYKDASIARQKIANGQFNEHTNLDTGEITYSID